MPQKTYTIDNLDCANCAAKIEASFNAHPQVEEAVIVFATRQLHLTAADPDALLPALERLAQTVEAGATIRPAAHNHAHRECSRGHEHHHDGCSCGHGHNHPSFGDRELIEILSGAGFFALGLILSALDLSWGLIVCAVTAYAILGGKILVTAGKNLIKGHIFDENFLMSIATLGAFAIREFPEAVGVMLFFRVGEYFEHRAVERSRSQILEALDLRPETVTLVSGKTVPAEDARVGDLILVRPGDRFPLDGTVISGESRIDTAPITGEPVPVAVKAGSAVLSGCVNLSGLVTLRTDKPLSESMVTRILDSVENAAASKPKIDRFITRFARIYTPIVVALAAATAVVPSVLYGNWNYWVYTALSFLVMSCPCALVLSVPLAFFSGIGTGSREGILFKGGLTIEALAGVKAVVMDKTGTVTQGTFTVRQVDGGDEVLRLCAQVEQFSSHPIAASIVSAARERGMEIGSAQLTEEIPGCGIRGSVGGREILCGNEALMKRFCLPLTPAGHCEAGTRVWVAADRSLLGSIQIADALKSDAAAAVAQLKAMGVQTAILTGDAREAAEAVAKELGVRQVYARLLPQEKLEKLQQLRTDHGAVMFVGDGINDAPVLSGADVGAAMGSGADAAIEAADVVFLTSQASAIPRSLHIARRTRRIALQNVIFALAVKGTVMVLGLLGLASMWAAVFADSGVAILCVLNSIRMLYRKQ